MRILRIIFVFALSATLCIQLQTLAAAAKPANGAGRSSKGAQSDKPKPEDVLRRMADYLGDLPAFSCHVEATLKIKVEGKDNQEITKLTVRLQRPNRLALIVDEGEMGMTVVSDGKQLTQCLPALKRYAINEVPSNFARMTDIDIPLKVTILSSTGAVIPANGDEYYKSLIAAETGSEYIGTERLINRIVNSKPPAKVPGCEYIGTERVGDVLCHHCRVNQRRFDWDIWIEDGKRPVVHQVALDLSKQFENVRVRYTVAFSNWNVSPKFKDSDFAFKPPADAEQVENLIEEEPPHPLLGKPAPAFNTVDLDGHPFDLKTHLGKSVVLLDFWATWCGPCVAAIPKVDAVAKKFADKGLIFRAVNVGEDAKTIKEFLESSKLEPPVAMDANNKISQAYKVSGIPQTVLIGKDGNVQVGYVGFSENMGDRLSAAIEDLLAGKDLASNELAKAEKARKKKADLIQRLDKAERLWAKAEEARKKQTDGDTAKQQTRRSSLGDPGQPIENGKAQ